VIIEKVLGNLHELPADSGEYAGLHREKVVLPSAQLVKRIQRVTTDHGKEIGIRLPSGSGDLRDGDILHVAEANMIVVSVLATDVLVIAPGTIHEMGVVAHSLGNRHLQAQFFDAASEYGAEVMVCAYDRTVEDYLKHVGVPYDRQERVMPVPFRHAEHSH
jgi:urease accessory protein